MSESDGESGEIRSWGRSLLIQAQMLLLRAVFWKLYGARRTGGMIPGRGLVVARRIETRDVSGTRPS